MRINRFEIPAFGPFTEKALDFSAQGPDLHVIFGPNEAGKSSALRALKAWLFGFPERSSDDFIHPRNQLLVGGELSASGKSLTFYRRKKRKGDLIDADHNTMDPALLIPFLGGLDLTLFESLYGIDHDSLVQGGREILAQQGEIGEALFSAGAGLGSLHQILEGMETEKDTLFRKQAQKPRINKALNLHKKLNKEIRDLSLQPEQWREHADRFDLVSRELQEANKKRLQLDRRRQHLERLHRALPLFSRRTKLLEQQHALGPLRPLPTDFSERRSATQQELRRANQQIEQAKARRTSINVKIKQLSPYKPIIEKAALVEDIFQRLGEYNKAKKDRPRLEGMRAVHLKEADRLLQIVAPSLNLERSEELTPLIRQKKQLLALTSRREALLQAQKDAEIRMSKAQQQLAAIENKLAKTPRPGDTAQLKMAVTKGRKTGDIDNRIRELEQDCETKKETLGLRLRQLGHWQGTTQQLLNLSLPLNQSIGLFQDRQQKLEQQSTHLITQGKEIEDELQHLHTRQQELIYGGEIPSEDELQNIRARRNRGWQLIYRNWIGQEDVTEEVTRYAPDTELSETFFGLMLHADNISDRLRLEADRVHGFAALQVKKEELKQRLDDNSKAQQALEGELKQHRQEWHNLWQPLNILPDSPKDMAGWHAEMEKLQHHALDLTDLSNKCKALAVERDSMQQEIIPLLSDNNLPFPKSQELEPLLVTAESFLEEQQILRETFLELSRDRERQTELVSQANREHVQGIKEQEQWQQQWRQTAILPGTKEPFAPEAAQDLLEAIEQILSALKEATEFKSRIQGIDRDCLHFEQEIETLTRDVTPELSEKPVGQCVQQLHDRLTKAGKEQTLHETYRKGLEELDAEIRESELELVAAGQEMKKLLALADCQNEEELILAEQKAADHKRLAEQLEHLEQDLQQVAGELSLDELSRQIQGVDGDSLPGELHELTMQITQEMDPAIQTLAEQKGEAGKMLEQMDGSELAARKVEELESNLAQLRLDAEHYLRLQVGINMLRREIDTFRSKNQDPVLTIASRLFAELTLGSFSGLKTDVDDRGEPILVGIRDDSKQSLLGVNAMSTGSRDQLYLSLRLASLQHRASNGQLMPFIVDDILINFDDARAAATLQVLAQLGQQNQLILFTHHRQVAKQAEAINGVTVHHLNTL